MLTRINWAKKSQQPVTVTWRKARWSNSEFEGGLLCRYCTSDCKKNKLIVVSLRTYCEYEIHRIAGDGNDGQYIEDADEIEEDVLDVIDDTFFGYLVLKVHDEYGGIESYAWFSRSRVEGFALEKSYQERNLQYILQPCSRLL